VASWPPVVWEAARTPANRHACRIAARRARWDAPATNFESEGTAMGERRSGWVTFAGVMLLLGGTMNVIYGIAGIGKSSFLSQNADYIFANIKTWGWITLVIGLIQVLAAGSLWRGGLYGRIIAIAAGGLSAIAALLAIPSYPFWSLVIFTVDVIIIYQVAVNGSAGRGAGSSSASARAYEGMAEYHQ
jgi:hypothetical protein